MINLNQNIKSQVSKPLKLTKIKHQNNDFSFN